MSFAGSVRTAARHSKLGDFDAAEQAVDRSRDRYVTGAEDWTAAYREFVRWQRGETPRPERVILLPNATDLMRYWSLEFRNARGDDPALLIREADVLFAARNRPRAALLSLRAVLLFRLGKRIEAQMALRAAWKEGVDEARTGVVARGHVATPGWHQRLAIRQM